MVHPEDMSMLTTCIWMGVIVCTTCHVFHADITSATEAATRCRHGLASHDDIALLENATSTMPEGSSAWVSGSTTLSYPVALDGCFNLPNNYVPVFNRSISLLYECAKECRDSRKNTFVIAIHGDSCYCIPSQEYRGLSPLRCEIDLVKMLQPDFKPPINNHILYKPWLYFNKAIGSYWQLLKENRSTVYGEQVSCYDMYGYICKEYLSDTILGCREKCGYGYELRWPNAAKVCEQTGGLLIPDINLYNYTNRHFWSGFFRPFIINKIMNGTEDTCLSVRKVYGRLVYEPDECIQYKYYICNEAHQTVMVSEKLKEKADISAVEDTDTYYSLLAIPVMLLLLTCFIFIKYMKKRSYQSQQQTCQVVWSTTAADDDDHYATIYDNRNAMDPVMPPTLPARRCLMETMPIRCKMAPNRRSSVELRNPRTSTERFVMDTYGMSNTSVRLSDTLSNRSSISYAFVLFPGQAIPQKVDSNSLSAQP